MGKLQTLGHLIDVADRVLPDDVKREAADQVKKVVEKVTPTPQEIASDLDHAATRMREKTPEAMERVSEAANKALDVAKDYAPNLVKRASSIVDEARRRPYGDSGTSNNNADSNTSSNGASN